ncbi:hypothetical protein SLEP1_g11290 [Rubroshorea leprosula]|uniref:Secreted protein n=1 Tax=Rubroshorea leprosula TaxID=152421 RepID=A0AAV5IJD0_9ROSI|nr:hypothetical protein SLEP1_g11290 [Rubroshorea leprosula]
MTEMGHRKGKRSGGCLLCWSVPSVRASSAFRGLGRCLFVSCYPVVQCFGWDDCRHRHHHHTYFQ